jgi:hypothetical protein
MKLTIIAVAAGAAAISGAAIAAKPSPLSPPPPSGTGLPQGECFRSLDIENHTIGDRSTLLIDVRSKGAYRVTMKGACLAGAISTDPLIMRSPPGSIHVCKPIDMDVAVSKGGFPTPCIVDSIVKMTPEEVAALPRKLRP